MPQALVGTGGFLAAALWMDLMFDFQALDRDGVLPGEALAVIAAYYHHVTTAAAPMGNVVSLVMLLTVLGSVLQLSRTTIPFWLRSGVLAMALVVAVLSLAWTGPTAVRLAAQSAPQALQSELARSILLGHLVCLGCVLAYLGLQIAAVQRLRGAVEAMPA